MGERADVGARVGRRGPVRARLLPPAASGCSLADLADALTVHTDGRYGFGALLFLLRLGRQLAYGPLRDSDRVSGVIALTVAADFKMNLIMKDLAQHLFPYLDAHLHLEPGTCTRPGSSRATVTSASRHFPLREPGLRASDCPVCSFWAKCAAARCTGRRRWVARFSGRPGLGIDRQSEQSV